jgi:predicted nucleic acid-binding protein
MTTGPTAFLDASVIYPAGIRNLLMYMQLAGTFRATWSDTVHEEWITALLRKRPHLTRAQLERTRDLMNQHAVGATITGYEGLIDGLRLPDANDRHVLAAAITAGASIIVTSNLKHFPASALAPRGIEALHPDDFALRLFGAAPASRARQSQLPTIWRDLKNLGSPTPSPHSDRSKDCWSDQQSQGVQ